MIRLIGQSVKSVNNSNTTTSSIIYSAVRSSRKTLGSRNTFICIRQGQGEGQQLQVRRYNMASSTAANGSAAATGGTGTGSSDSWANSSTGSSTATPAQYDFRSDVMTRPTTRMLEAIKKTSLRDDVASEDPVTNALEAHVAKLAGKEAGLLVMSGTMGNQVALRTHLTSPPHAIICDARSHIMMYEAGAASLISGAMMVAAHPNANGHHLTVEDIRPHVVTPTGNSFTDVHSCPTRVICLENTLNGMITPQEDIQAIADAFAKKGPNGNNGILLHLDAARIWEVAAATKTPLATLLAPFDSASLCFSKGLGAPIGSIVVGSADFIQRARHIRKILGGGTRQPGIISAPARIAVDETFLGLGLEQSLSRLDLASAEAKANKGGIEIDTTGQKGRLPLESHAKAHEIGQRWVRKGGKLTYPVETNMVWLDLSSGGASAEQEFVRLATKNGLKVFGPRLVVHYQISQDAIDRLDKTMNEVLELIGGSASNGASNGASGPATKAKENIYGQ